jgi:hypothetical protein
VSDQVAGILLGIASLVIAAVLVWGAFAEERRANRAFVEKRGSGNAL